MRGRPLGPGGRLYFSCFLRFRRTRKGRERNAMRMSSSDITCQIVVLLGVV